MFGRVLLNERFNMAVQAIAVCFRADVVHSIKSEHCTRTNSRQHCLYKRRYPPDFARLSALHSGANVTQRLAEVYVRPTSRYRILLEVIARNRLLN